jgi:hypothetical protein
MLLTGCLNPGFVNTVSNSMYPLAPGDEPFVLIRLVNQTSAEVTARVDADYGTADSGGPQASLISPNEEIGFLLEAPVLRVTLGNLDDDPFEPSLQAQFPGGLNILFPVGIEPLEFGEDYSIGDTIVFVFYNDARSETSILVSVGVIDGDSQTGSFRANTFTTIRQVLELYDLLGTVSSSQIQ